MDKLRIHNSLTGGLRHSKMFVPKQLVLKTSEAGLLVWSRQWVNRVLDSKRQEHPWRTKLQESQLRVVVAARETWRTRLFNAPAALRSLTMEDMVFITPSLVRRAELGQDLIRINFHSKLPVETSPPELVSSQWEHCRELLESIGFANEKQKNKKCLQSPPPLWSTSCSWCVFPVG